MHLETLSTLVAACANWLHHIPHDADSDVRELRCVVMVVFQEVRCACIVFSIDSTKFMTRTGS
jgi:hypothetical protein